MQSQKKILIGFIEVLALWVLCWTYFFPFLKGAEDYVFIYPFNLKDGSLYWGISKSILITTLLFFGNIYYAIPKFLKRNKLKAYLICIVVLFFGLLPLEQGLEELIKYFYNLPGNFENVYGTDYESLPMRRSLAFPHILRNTGFLALSFGYRYFKDWQHLLKKQTREQTLLAEKRKVELSFLKSQVNPHFLFNSLNNIYAITERNKDSEASEAITKLSNLMRFMIYDSQTEFINLSKEIKYIRDYIEIQQLRYAKEEVIINLKINGDVQNVKVSPFMLIPFVENAFKYGVAIHQSSIIKISISVENDNLHFNVRNKILNTANNHVYSGIGVDNVKKRLQLEYRNKHDLDIKNDNEYFDVNLRIQF